MWSHPNTPRLLVADRHARLRDLGRPRHTAPHVHTPAIVTEPEIVISDDRELADTRA